MFSEYALALSLMAFFATSVDDFCVLLIFFSREYDKTNDLGDASTQRAFFLICIGQFVGFTIIVGVALAIGIGLSQTVDEDWIDLIGFIPMLIGVYLIYELMAEAGYWDSCCAKPEDDDAELDMEHGTSGSHDKVDEKTPLVGSKGEAGGAGTETDGVVADGVGKSAMKATKRVQIDDPKSAQPSDEEGGGMVGDAPSKAMKKRVSIDERNNTTSDEESKEPPTRHSGDGEGLKAPSTDESDEERPKPKAKPRRKRTLSADLSGRYFESLNDRIDVSNALGEAMGDNKSGKSQSVFSKWITCFLDPLSQEVILYVLIFGIDNLAIFTVLFANVTEIEIVVVVVVFYALLFFYIALTIIILMQCPTVGHWFGNNVRYLVPFVLIGFGIYILYGSVIWQPDQE